MSIHTLEGFARWLYPEKNEQQLRAAVYWLSSLSFQKQKKKQYQHSTIPKRNGAVRELWVPSYPLQRVQRGVMELISQGEISPAATAYQKGISLVQNAAPHQGHPVVVQLDLKDFFQSVSFSQVAGALDDALRRNPLIGEHFYTDLGGNPRERRKTAYNDVLSYYFAQFCTYKGCLPQGAPSSPMISNLVFAPLDQKILAYCEKHQITYTRYSDDLTFSGEFQTLTPGHLIGWVRRLMAANGYELNQEKIRVRRGGERHCVTGLVVNQTVQPTASFRRDIRQKCYYLNRFGIEDFLRRHGGEISGEKELERLLGQIQFVLQVSPENRQFSQYRKQVRQALKEVKTGTVQK
ncbi:MAG: reverse transcriptase family protein [Massiliimalia sp.]